MSIVKTSELYEWTSDQYHYPDTTVVGHQPFEPVRILNVELLSDVEDVDISYVQVANVMLAMFSKFIPVCLPSYTINVFINRRLPYRIPVNDDRPPAPFKVRITAERMLS